tara:strand:- start:575 stop:814 length:240 start_codon:yes stop_codon:yes gene_type:complete
MFEWKVVTSNTTRLEGKLNELSCDGYTIEKVMPPTIEKPNWTIVAMRLSESTPQILEETINNLVGQTTVTPEDFVGGTE